MVPMPNYTKINGKPLSEMIKKEKLNSIIDRTRKGGAEIIKYLHNCQYIQTKAEAQPTQSTRAWYAPAAGAVATGVTFEGPTVVHFTIQTPFGKLRQIKTLLSVEPFKQFVESRWYAERSVPRIVELLMELDP